MFVLVLAAEADETRQAITFLIVCLVGIAVLLAMLTAWYWHYTSPRRQADVATAVADADADADADVDVAVDVDTDRTDPPVVAKTADRARLIVPSRRERIEVVERSKSSPKPSDPEPSVPEPLAVAESVDTPGPVAVAAHVVATSTGTATAVAPDRIGNGPAGDGLSDDAWAAAMKSAFDKLQQ